MIFIPTIATFLTGLLTTLFVLVCIFLILVILIQKPRGGGLTGAFGGAGGNAASVFGSKTGDVLTWFTVVCFVLFIGLAMGLTWAAKPTRGPANVLPTVNPTTNNPEDGPETPLPGVTPVTPKDKDNFDVRPPALRDGETKDGKAPKVDPAKDAAPKVEPTKDAAPSTKDGAAPAPAPAPAPTKDAAPAKDAK